MKVSHSRLDVWTMPPSKGHVGSGGQYGSYVYSEDQPEVAGPAGKQSARELRQSEAQGRQQAHAHAVSNHVASLSEIQSGLRAS